MEVANRSVLRLTPAPDDSFSRKVVGASGGLPDTNKTMRVIRVAVVLGAVSLTIACLPARVPFSAIPLPPAAEAAKLEGPEEVPIDLTQGDIHEAVREGYGKPRIEIYALPAETDWGKVTQFYAEQFNGKDWQPEPRLSRRKGYYEMTGWSRGGSFDRQALVVAFLSKPEGARRNYLLVALAPGEDN